MIPLYLDQDQEEPWDAVERKVVSLTKDSFPVQPNKQRLVEHFASSIDRYEGDCEKAVVGGVWVLFTEDGSYNVCWNTSRSKLPSSAALGVAMIALAGVS
jgi:hypothetical protein